jgi:hypothetical protein
MSDEQLRGESSREEYVEHLKAIMEQEALIRAANEAPEEPPNPFLARVPVVAIVALLFSTVVAHNVRAWTPDPAPQAVALQERTAGVSLLVAAQRIEDYREEHGELPATLADAGLGEDAFRYDVFGDRFELETIEGPGQSSAIYRSEDGPAAIVEQLAEPFPTEE